MADDRERDRMTFETSELVKRAIRMRAAIDGVKPADVVNSALAGYVSEELAVLKARSLEGAADAGGEDARAGRKRKEDRN